MRWEYPKEFTEGNSNLLLMSDPEMPGVPPIHLIRISGNFGNNGFNVTADTAHARSQSNL